MQQHKLVLYIRHELKKQDGKTESIISEVDQRFETEEEAIKWAEENTQNTENMTYYYRVQPWFKIQNTEKIEK